METAKPLTQDEKLDLIIKTTKRIEIIHLIGVSIVVLAFVGISSLSDAKNKLHKI